MRTTVRAALLVTAASIARGAAACAASASPKDPNIWPVVGLFMLVPWILAAVVTILVRRESTSFFGRRKSAHAPLAGVLGFPRAKNPRPA